jgi:hypothetical protein
MRRDAPIRTNPGIAGTGTNHPFTMTMNPGVLSTKSFTPQVPLYHCPLVMHVGTAVDAMRMMAPSVKSRQ